MICFAVVRAGKGRMGHGIPQMDDVLSVRMRMGWDCLGLECGYQAWIGRMCVVDHCLSCQLWY